VEATYLMANNASLRERGMVTEPYPRPKNLEEATQNFVAFIRNEQENMINTLNL
jgi:hypothetical protein